MAEPVGGLSPKETDHLTAVVRRIAASDPTIILIEHPMRLPVELSTRVMTMAHCEGICEVQPKGLTSDRMVIDVSPARLPASAWPSSWRRGLISVALAFENGESDYRAPG